MADEKLNNPKTSVRVFISGKVQGVGYRFSTRQEARKLGLKGWVRNLPDFRVEAVLYGEITAVEAMIAWCYNGPSAAVVKEVTVEPIEIEITNNFEIR